MTYEKMIENLKFNDCIARLPEWPEGHILVMEGEYLLLIDKHGNVLQKHRMPSLFRQDWELEYVKRIKNE